MNPAFWSGRRVFLTGHTGFKGSWMALWLQSLGSNVSGYSLAAPTDPSLFEVARVAESMQSQVGDIRDAEDLERALRFSQAEIVIHMAAQSLVRQGYDAPLETYATNVMGTVHLLEAVRRSPEVRAVLVVTSDKCYDNREWAWGYRESDPLGGRDPYSSSKGCAELVTAAYRESFFAPHAPSAHRAAITSVRAGNVIGGGDWARDRLVPDILRSNVTSVPVRIRQPDAVRPWQHVLDALHGYLMLAERLVADAPTTTGAWNFGPSDDDARPVRWLVERLALQLGAAWEIDAGTHPHESHYLKLDCSKARSVLGWKPQWTLEDALDAVVDWHRHWLAKDDMRSATLGQIAAYQARATTP
jgi:CDP-glucose 4,6-dehydratase